MGEFFRGWRRKVGCLTLVMALMTMGGWVRSYSAEDKAWIPLQTSIRIVSTSRGCLHLCYANCESPSSINQIPQDVSFLEFDGKKSYVVLFANLPFRSRWTTSVRVAADVEFPERDPDLKQWRAWGIACAAKSRTFILPNGMIRETIEFYTIPYWSIVIPLTALSAFLLLSKPHKSNPVKSNDPNHDDGGGTT